MLMLMLMLMPMPMPMPIGTLTDKANPGRMKISPDFS